MSKTYLGNKDVFSTNLTYYIELNGVTQREVAKHIKVTESSITDWITKRHYPRLDKIQLLADFFGVEVTDLVEPRKEKSATSKKTVTDQEQVILDLFHKVPDEKKEFLLKMIQAAIDTL
jgi:transcriptional regulator with XRE-family HTH domain